MQGCSDWGRGERGVSPDLSPALRRCWSPASPRSGHRWHPSRVTCGDGPARGLRLPAPLRVSAGPPSLTTGGQVSTTRRSCSGVGADTAFSRIPSGYLQLCFMWPSSWAKYLKPLETRVHHPENTEPRPPPQKVAVNSGLNSAARRWHVCGHAQLRPRLQGLR